MSIFKKLTILFIISFILMTVIGLWIDNINSKRVDNFAKEKYLKVIDDIFKNIENKNYLDSLILKNSLEKVNFLDENNLETIYSQNSAFTDISILKYKSSNIYILKIKYLDESYIKSMYSIAKESKYMLSNEKIMYMIRRFVRDGFTTFWQ